MTQLLALKEATQDTQEGPNERFVLNMDWTKQCAHFGQILPSTKATNGQTDITGVCGNRRILTSSLVEGRVAGAETDRRGVRCEDTDWV